MAGICTGLLSFSAEEQFMLSHIKDVFLINDSPRCCSTIFSGLSAAEYLSIVGLLSSDSLVIGLCLDVSRGDILDMPEEITLSVAFLSCTHLKGFQIGGNLSFETCMNAFG